MHSPTAKTPRLTPASPGPTRRRRIVAPLAMIAITGMALVGCSTGGTGTGAGTGGGATGKGPGDAGKADGVVTLYGTIA